MNRSNLVFLFPGQGSQFVGMGKRFVNDFETKRIFERANETLGYNLAEIIFNGPPKRLKQTKYAQPAIVVDSFVKYGILKRKGIVPLYSAGHSLGEFSALISAEVLEFETGLELVQKRAELMSEETEDGSMMAVVGLDVEVIRGAVEGNPGVCIANYNSPRQVVLSGSREAFDSIGRELEDRGGKCIELDVSGPFHSPYMEEAERKLAPFIEELRFSDPKFPIISSVTGRLESRGDRLKSNLSSQITHPVLWVDYVKELARQGMGATVEVGPGCVLKDLSSRVVPEVEHYCFEEVI